ncbi:transmembrane protein -like [Brachionus plicatilis]|uniref:Transmembrane protein-like n=1 Tax=Brachionus plicatilis TaxID=10195 RepID=A0A3M7STN5_BRAPC|nr:transmembrane protein -like [Brachionus plicatilis]
MLEWSYSGVNFSLKGNGGPDCVNFLSPTSIISETILIIIYSLVAEIYYPWTRSISNYKPNLELRERFGRKLLLASLCLIWGIEIGYKLSTRQLIFILNPCHVVTFLQIILLISPPRNWMHILFRFQTYVVSGATIAIIFPVLNTRILPFEKASYYIHHALMLVTPLYLMRLGGIYNMEPLSNFHWGFISIGFMRLYHYLVLQPISFMTEVNLNSIMCPAVSDPFEGPWYRIAAHIHQTLFILLHGKIYCIIGQKFFVPKQVEIKTVSVHDAKKLIDANGNCIEPDGYAENFCFNSEKLSNGSNIKED